MKGELAPVEASSRYRGLAAAHPGVEVWPHEGFSDVGWSHAWIVSRSGECAVRNLAYVRLLSHQLQQRVYDGAGEDLWLPIELSRLGNGRQMGSDELANRRTGHALGRVIS